MYGILRCFEDPITEKGFRKILFGLEGYPPHPSATYLEPPDSNILF